MTRTEIMRGLESLIEDRGSFFTGDGGDEKFRRDADVLTAARGVVMTCAEESGFPLLAAIRGNEEGYELYMEGDSTLLLKAALNLLHEVCEASGVDVAKLVELVRAELAAESEDAECED